MKFFFTVREYNSIISISIIVFDMELLFNCMIQFRQIYICEILTQIISNRHPVCAIYYLIEQL